MRVVRVLGGDLLTIELPDGSTAAGGDVLHLDDAVADWLTVTGMAEEIPWTFDRIRFTRPGFLGFEAGQIVFVAWAPTEPDVETSAEAELATIAAWWSQFRSEGASEADFRAALRESERYGVYATLDELPEPEPPTRRTELRIGEALAAVEGGFAEPVGADVDELARWLASQPDG